MVSQIIRIGKSQSIRMVTLLIFTVNALAFTQRTRVAVDLANQKLVDSHPLYPYNNLPTLEAAHNEQL